VGSSVEVMGKGFGGDDAGVEGAVREVGYGLGVVKEGKAGSAVLQKKSVDMLSVFFSDIFMYFYTDVELE